MSRVSKLWGCGKVLCPSLVLILGINLAARAQNRPPQIVEVYRDYLKPEGVAANRKLENRAEQLCHAEFHAPLSDHRVYLRPSGNVVLQWVRVASRGGETQAGIPAKLSPDGCT